MTSAIERLCVSSASWAMDVKRFTIKCIAPLSIRFIQRFAICVDSWRRRQRFSSLSFSWERRQRHQEARR